MEKFENSKRADETNVTEGDIVPVGLLENDPIEEIFALNLGDFLCEHLISPDFAHKIGSKAKTKNESLETQFFALPDSLKKSSKQLLFCGEKLL